MVKMANKVATATKSSVGSKATLVPVSLDPGYIVHGGLPHNQKPPSFLWVWHSLQKHFPFLSVKFTEKHGFLRALPIARPVPSPNCPLTAVCKLTSGTRPRDARISLRGVLAADGRGKLSHSEVRLLIL
ncbi:MAG: hypothetical protein [Anelloviridae sp.]|nr:MAG: hypothetical protein [Anelloviridae sp.]